MPQKQQPQDDGQQSTNDKILFRKDGDHIVLGSTFDVGNEDYYDFPTAKGSLPVASRGGDTKVACYDCSWKGEVSELKLGFVPIGGKKRCKLACPECDSRLAADYNTHRTHTMPDEYVVGRAEDIDKLVR